MRTGSLAKLSAPTRAAEERIVEEAHACIQVNDAIAGAYSELFPEHAHKQHVVMNGYDTHSIPGEVTPPTDGPVTFGMLGTVTDLWPLGALFEAWHATRGHLAPGSMIRLGGHLGYFPWSADPLLATFPDESAGFEYVGPVPKTKVSEFYSGLDAVIVPLFGGPMVTAGKVLEVAALGLPILCIQGRDGGARHFYESHPLAVGVDPDPDLVGPALLETARLARETSVEARIEVRRSMARYERLTAMGDLVAIVSEASELETESYA
jgi:glycosyltransferase involved in cell wall biosynthesis